MGKMWKSPGQFNDWTETGYGLSGKGSCRWTAGWGYDLEGWAWRFSGNGAWYYLWRESTGIVSRSRSAGSYKFRKISGACFKNGGIFQRSSLRYLFTSDKGSERPWPSYRSRT